MGCVHVHVVFILLLAALVDGQCDGSAKEITRGTGEMSSPNFDSGGEYGNSANCSWEFKPTADGKDYALVLTVEQLKLYVVKGGKHCIGSYDLTFNHDEIECDRYVHGDTTGSENVTANYFCNAYYSSPICANISKIQGCEKKRQTSFPVPVTYVSDGRRDSTATSTTMYFKIRYKLIGCPQETATTTTTTSNSKPATTKASEPATYAPTSDSAAFETTTVPLSDKATTQSTINPPTHAPEKNTLTAIQTSMNSAVATNKIDVNTPTSNGGSLDPQQDMIIIIAAAAGGGGLIAIVSVVLIVVICKRKRKINITQPKHNVEVVLEEVNHSNDGAAGNDNQAGQPEEPSSPTVELYATVSKPRKVVKLVDSDVGVDNGDQSEAWMDNGGSQSTQPIAELYATVSKPPRVTEAKSQQPQDTNVTTPDQPEACLYATVSKPPRVTEQPQSSQPQDEHVTAPDQPEACLYAAVSIKRKGVKETVHYKKDMVDNVLYGINEDYK